MNEIFSKKSNLNVISAEISGYNNPFNELEIIQSSHLAGHEDNHIIGHP